MSQKINITSKGIQRVLKAYNEKQAIAEYIWNGFDANATIVRINYKTNALGGLEEFSIADNGYGIDFKNLKSKFDPFFESEKSSQITVPKHTSKMHGRNGVGRLTFFTFATSATWTTTYKSTEGYQNGTIEIKIGALNSYNHNFESPLSPQGQTGTEVTFLNLSISVEEVERSVIPFLIDEFCWFIELNRSKNYRILVNDHVVDFERNVHSRESFSLAYPDSDTVFNIRYVQWHDNLHKELSKYYFLYQGEEVYKDYTTLNKKSDEYFHSIYIESDFFGDFDFKSSETETQSRIFGKAKSSPEYRFLIKELTEFLKLKRKPFLKEYADRLIDSYEKEGIFPEYLSEWERKFKKPELLEVIKALYEVEPKLFSSLNIDQKKTFVRLLNLLLDSNERESLFGILEQVVDLETEEREDLASLFRVTKLNRITETIKMIRERYEVYYKLKDLVFNPELKANEVDHLQKLVEHHYWMFGEQYHLLTAAEPKFNEALRRYVHLLTDKDVVPDIQHEHKLKEMDIFACRQNISINRIDNIVVELKHPSINLGASQYHQVYNYLELISKQPEFNAPIMHWEFYLVGNKFDSTNFIKSLINTNKANGQQSMVLMLEEGRIKFFVKTWSEIFAEFEIKHKHLDERLSLEREELLNQHKTAEATILSV